MKEKTLSSKVMTGSISGHIYKEKDVKKAVEKLKKRLDELMETYEMKGIKLVYKEIDKIFGDFK